MFSNAFSKTLLVLGTSLVALFSYGCSKKSSTESTVIQDKKITESTMSQELTETQKIHLTLGYSIGTDLMLSDYSEDEVAQILEGLRLASKEEEPDYVKGLQDQAFQILNEKRTKAQAEQSASAVSTNKAAGEAFFATLEGKEGITKTDSGLRYEILTEGSDVFATAADSVNVHYHGTLIDGTVFDSSVQRGEPVTFPLNGVIKGFSEGLTLVGEGGKIRLYMPSDIAYGDRGAGGAIGPGASLIFEVEILKINP